MLYVLCGQSDITEYYSDLYEGKMKNIIRNATEPETVTKKSNEGGMSVIDKSGGEMSKVLTVTTAQCLDSTSVFK